MRLSGTLHEGISSKFLRTIASPADDVQIWLATLDSISPNELDELANALDSSEHARARQFRFAQDRHRFVATRGFLRRLLGEKVNLPASGIEFAHGEHGKPEISITTHEDKLRFNVSHAAGFALFALAWNRNVGVDLESAARLTNPSGQLAKHVLSPHEFAIWSALPDDESRRRALLRAWTRKEAYVKATGKGLSQRLHEIEVALDAARPDPSIKIDRNWTLYDVDVPKDLCAALVVEQIERKP
jgi:4'-phosphopantetheinyl transferase